MKKILTLLILLSVITCLLASCSSKNTENSENQQETSLTTGAEIDSRQLLSYGNMINNSDREVTDLMGEGEDAYIKGDTDQVLSARLYQSNILGFTGETVIVYDGSISPQVTEVLITFSGAAFSDVVDAISQQLGDASRVEKTKGDNAEAIWETEDTTFDLTYYSGTLLLTIS